MAAPGAAMTMRPSPSVSEWLLPLFLLAAGSIGTLAWNLFPFALLIELLD
jgi:hypothetical protein